MENDHQRPPKEQTSQSSKSSRSKSSSKEQQSPIYQCDWFPMTTSPWIASISFLFQIFLPIYMIDFYAEKSNQVFNTTGSFTLISGFIMNGMESIAYVFCTILSLISFMTLLWNKCEEEEGYKYILGWLGTKIFPFLRYLIDINLAIAALFMMRTPIVAAFFFIAAIINLIISFFCQNYTLRKDYLCCKSMQYLMMWKIAVVLSYALTCLGFYLIKASITLIIFTSLQLAIMIALFVFYFVFGYLMYRHPSSQFAYLLILNIFCSIAAGNMYDTLVTMITNQYVINRNLIFAGYFCVFLAILMYCLWSNIRKKRSLIDNKDPIERIYFMFHKLQNSSENINDDCQIRGIIRYHLSHTCKNLHCFVNMGEQNFYDSKKNKYCFSNKLNQGKTSFVKFIVKCIYEQELQNIRWNNIDLLLDYIEFYYMKLKNLFEVTILLIELEKKFLTPFQKLRLTRLRRVMLEENRKLNEQLYNGGLDLQNLIVSETKYDEIQQQIKELQLKNIEFWKYIENYSINLSIMVRMLKPSFSLVDKINTNWKSIAKYFQIQKVWKFMFACYTLYFRNQKLKPQLLEQFGQSVHEDELFATDSLHMNKTTQANQQYVSKMIFEQDVCCVHINHSQQKPIIKSVSRYFERMFGYDYNQIVQSSLDIMMTPSFQAFHRTKFLKWAQSGKSNKQQNYDVKKVFPMNKNGYIISTFKFYKQYLCLDNQLQYVGMFKKNKEQQFVMILNEDYEIEGMTESLANRLGINTQIYKHVLGLNLLILIPDLVKFTKFEEQSRAFAHNLIYAQPTAMIPSISCQMSQKTASKKTSINSSRQFTKNNLHLVVPSEIKPIKEAYKKQGLISLTHRLANAIQTLQQTQNKKKYKIEVEVRMVQFLENNSYFEFYIREVESFEKTSAKTSDIGMVYDQKSLQPNEEILKQQDLNKFFENSHSSQNISLAFSDNIFIKEDNNQPVQMISYVKEITLIVRIIFVIFFGFLVSSLLFEYSNYQSYKQNSLKTYAMVKLQLELFMLDNKYHSEILGIRQTSETIPSLTTSLRQIRQKNIEFKKSILDPTINKYKIYNIMIDSKKQPYDQIDIIDKMFESVIEILYSFQSAGQITTTSFQTFTNIVLPSVQFLTSDATKSISKIFDQIYKKIQIKNYIYIAAGIVLLVLGFVLILFKLIKIAKSFVNLVQIFTQFNEADLKKIIRYCLTIQQLFSHLRKKYDLFKQISTEMTPKTTTMPEQYYNSSISNCSYSSKLGPTPLMNPDTVVDQNQELDNANLNKKVKKVVVGKQLTNLKIKSIVFSVVFLFLYGLTTFGLGLYTSLINQQIIQFKNAGEEIFQYFSAFNIYYLSTKDKMINKQKFSWNKYQIYYERLQKMKTIQYTAGQRLSVDYMSVRNLVLFGNICNLSQVLASNGYTVQTCVTINDNNFQHGVQSFLFYMITNVQYFQSGTSYTIEPQLLKQIEKGVSISNIYLKYLLNKWSEYFVNTMNVLEMDIIIICSGMFVLQIVIYIVLVQVLIVGNLKEKFLFFRKVYNYLMPDFIVTKEKIIKAKLEVEGFIKK